jgi:hypothetical protein
VGLLGGSGFDAGSVSPGRPSFIAVRSGSAFPARLSQDVPVVAGMSRDELVSGLVRIGELEISGEDQTEVDS